MRAVLGSRSFCVVMYILHVLADPLSQCTIHPDNNLHTVSSTSSTPVSVSFTNEGNADLDVLWLSSSGAETSMGYMEPQDTLYFSTYSGHAWRVRLLVSRDVVFEVTLPEGVSGDTEYSVGGDCVGGKSEEDPDEKYFADSLFRTSRSYELVSNPDEVDAKVATSPCSDLGLSDWVSRSVAVPGYHVLCVVMEEPPASAQHTEWGMDVEAWREGYRPVNQNAGQVFMGSSIMDIRQYIEELLGFRRTDKFLDNARSAIRRRLTTRGVRGSGMEYAWAHLPHAWAMFTPTRDRILSAADLYSSLQREEGRARGLVLVFEGGQFIYPGVEVGFNRSIWISDAEMEFTLTTLSVRPLVFGIDNFLKPEEVEYIVSNAAPHMQDSPVSLMDKDKGKKATEFRTSQLLFMSSAKYPALSPLDVRVAGLTGCKMEQQEAVQVLKYEVGQYYLPHLDFWDPQYYQDPSMVRSSRAGHRNRLSTVFWYMSDCEGGHTAFPNAPVSDQRVSQVLLAEGEENRQILAGGAIDNYRGTMECPYGLRVPPKKGNAILFYSLLPSGDGDALSQHSACAVKQGTKWAANKWVWNEKARS
mmetsp:Transcript_23902/g.35079  ORF Transcript_23902/g.35079 Transcript_23902/m.35079 type:complete len:585 (+) Transcript_23902:94-1848(+)|eukprot:CAMPEP_0185037042 /NCGR_PEP_ID=MMETSP1103-20130426/30922_1 /TAXON_ID=36769 /ORGANISM="Paraphysomonas bandaiensis, Strain Caron Lab Isolate" /LENGTH=584 /DNA_ID=CAMNT_0027574839 /DNA_START=27 /DNA_END=1781 /DNA_ORIENTATION=-